MNDRTRDNYYIYAVIRSGYGVEGRATHDFFSTLESACLFIANFYKGYVEPEVNSFFYTENLCIKIERILVRGT